MQAPAIEHAHRDLEAFAFFAKVVFLGHAHAIGLAVLWAWAVIAFRDDGCICEMLPKSRPSDIGQFKPLLCDPCRRHH